MYQKPIEFVRVESFLPDKIDIKNDISNIELVGMNWSMMLAKKNLRWYPGMAPSELKYQPEDFCRYSVGGHSAAIPFPNSQSAIEFANATGLKSVYICPKGMSASDMASHAMAKVLDGAPRDSAAPQFLLYSYTMPEEDSNLNPAFRLQHESGYSDLLPFAVSQNDVISTFTSLELALRLVNAQEATDVLLVAADKCMLPMSRRLSDITLLGDAASAAHLRVANADSLLVAHDVMVAHLTQPPEIWRLDASELDALQDQYVTETLRLADALLARNGLKRTDIGLVVPQRINSRLEQVIHRDLGIPASAIFDTRAGELGNLSSADLLVSLGMLIEQSMPHESKWVLAWGIGLGGHVGCALLRLNTGSNRHEGVQHESR